MEKMNIWKYTAVLFAASSVGLFIFGVFAIAVNIIVVSTGVVDGVMGTKLVAAYAGLRLLIFAGFFSLPALIIFLWYGLRNANSGVVRKGGA
ncbi:hypothetical protein CL614_05955 [archaeon]|nr:hypothetical protein [archaeon]|tara:strand:+ start:139 stop:414 length:276 start_codon:yes stop_codon:yes gene_type:complete